MKQNPARKYPSATKDRPRRKRRPPKPIMITVQQVHCKDCRRKFELHPEAPAVFCVWCRSEKIQKLVKIRRETPAERTQREAEFTARMVNAAMHLFGGLFGVGQARPGFPFSTQPEVRNGSDLEAELLKEGYRNLAKKYHPDKGGDPEKMKELNRLKEKLGL